MGKMDEQIMVVDRKKLFSGNYFQGFSNSRPIDYEQRVLQNFLFMRRGDAEANPEYKQPIGYVLIVNLAMKKIFAYRRSSAGGEGRLYEKWSWGVGGHIDLVDSAGENPIHASIARELEEEVSVKINHLKVLGYINDDSNSVGKVHFGILYIAETDSEEVAPNSDEMAEGRLRTFEELNSINSAPEYDVEEWSRISLEPLRVALARI